MDLRRYLFGKDVFISYSRADGMRYAAALAETLSGKGFRVELDQWGSTTGEQIPARLVRSLRRAECLVIVGSTGAAGSRHVAWEVENFPRLQRPVVAISFAGALENAPWFAQLKGVAVEPENAENLAHGTPAQACTRRIENSLRFTRQEIRVRRAFLTATVVLAGLIVVAGWQIQRATTAMQARVLARSQELAALSRSALDSDPELSVRLAQKGLDAAYSIDADIALRNALAASHSIYRLTGHQAAVNSVAYSADGKRLVTASDDRTVRVWDAHSGAQIAVLGPLRNKMVAALLSPDDNYLVTTTYEETQIWSTSDWKQRWAFPGKAPSGLFARRGQVLASDGASSATLRFRAIEDGTEIGDFVAQAGEYFTRLAALSPDGQWVALELGTSPTSIRVWNTQTSHSTDLQASEFSGDVDRLLFSPDSLQLAAVFGESTQVWKLGIDRTNAFATHLGAGRIAAAFSSDGRRFVGVGNDRADRWTTFHEGPSSGDSIGLNHEGLVWAAALAPDSRFIVTGGGADKVAKRWDLSAMPYWEPLRTTYAGHAGRVNRVAISPVDQQFATASDDGTARIWRVSTLEQIHSCDVRRGMVIDTPRRPADAGETPDGQENTARESTWLAAVNRHICARDQKEQVHIPTWLSFTRQGDRTAIGTAAGDVLVADEHTVATHEFPHLEGTKWVRFAHWTPDEHSIVSADDSRRQLTVWNASTRAPRFGPDAQHYDHSDIVLAARISRDGRYAVSIGLNDPQVKVWDLSTGKFVTQLAHDDAVQSVDVSPSEDLVVTGERGGRISLWSLPQGTPQHRTIGDTSWNASIDVVRFSADGSQIVSGGADFRVKIWSTNDLSLNGILDGHRTGINDIALSPDGMLLASVDHAGVARIWEMRSSTSLAEIIESTGTMKFPRVAFSPLGSLLAVSTNTEIRIFDCPFCGDLNRVQDNANRLVGRELSAVERRRFSIE